MSISFSVSELSTIIRCLQIEETGAPSVSDAVLVTRAYYRFCSEYDYFRSNGGSLSGVRQYLKLLRGAIKTFNALEHRTVDESVVIRKLYR